MIDRLGAIMAAHHALHEEARSPQPNEAIKLAAELVIKYVKPEPQFAEMSQPKESE